MTTLLRLETALRVEGLAVSFGEVMPLFFASSALYPISIMPGWLRVVAHANPLSYEVHGMRQLLLGISAGGTLWLDFVVAAAFLVTAAVVAAKTYPRAIL